MQRRLLGEATSFSAALVLLSSVATSGCGGGEVLGRGRDVAASGPAAPVITLPAANPHYSNTANLTLSGTCIAGFRVDLTGSDTQDMICTGGGTFSFSIVQGTPGSYNFSVTQTDSVDALTSGAATRSWVYDTDLPATPGVSSPAAATTYTNLDTFAITGTCETGATVNLTGGDTQNVGCPAGTYTFNIGKTSDSGKAPKIAAFQP
jgi:hypothetical protein